MFLVAPTWQHCNKQHFQIHLDNMFLITRPGGEKKTLSSRSSSLYSILQYIHYKTVNKLDADLKNVSSTF